MRAIEPLIRSLQRSYPGRLWGRLRRALGWRRRGYGARVDEEKSRFAAVEVVNDLPPAFHHWSHNRVRPLLLEFGFANPIEFFANAIAERAQAANGARAAMVLSVGAGNCDLEVAVAAALVARGVERFAIECLELNAAMLARGRALAQGRGVARHMAFCEGDANAFRAVRGYDVVMANQSLHHVVRLEHLFDEVRRCLLPGGVVAINDTIGRNGHLRWPEARAVVERLWDELPEGHRYNLQLRRQEDRFLDWDCSAEGFEGVRAQDILPLLLERFHVRLFVPFGNVIDAFVDRSFGPHFDIARAWDREFLDRVHRLDEELLAAGRITPTHLYAVFGREPCTAPRLSRGLDPQACVRRTPAG